MSLAHLIAMVLTSKGIEEILEVYTRREVVALLMLDSALTKYINEYDSSDADLWAACLEVSRARLTTILENIRS